MLYGSITRQQRPETTPGRVETAPGLGKMANGRVKTAPGLRKMANGRVETAPGLRKMTHGRVETDPGPLPALHCAISSCAVTAQWHRVGTPDKPEMVLIKGRNSQYPIFSKGSKGLQWRVLADNIQYKTLNADRSHDAVRFQHPTTTADSDLTACETPVNVKRAGRDIESGSWDPDSYREEDGSFSGTPVSHFLFLISYFLFFWVKRGNEKYRIFNIQYSILKKGNNEHPIRNIESGGWETEPETCNLKLETWNLEPSHTMTSSHSMTAKYKAAPLLPRGRFYSGDCPGAAAITILSNLFSSPRVSPTWDAEFETPHWDECGVVPKGSLCGNSTSRSACKGLPVINQVSFFSSFGGGREEALNQKGGTPMS